MKIRTTVLAIALTLSLGATVANANLFVNWAAGSGFYYDNGDPLLHPDDRPMVLAQLIWTPTATPNSAMADVDDYVSGGDVWLADYWITYAGNGEWGEFLNAPNVSSSEVSGGYIYARVFTSDSPTEGTWYYRGPTIANANIDSSITPTPTPQSYDVNRDWDPIGGDGAGLGDIVDAGPYAFQVVPVPEPGTIALLALGAVTLAASRRRRKV